LILYGQIISRHPSVKNDNGLAFHFDEKILEVN